MVHRSSPCLTLLMMPRIRNGSLGCRSTSTVMVLPFSSACQILLAKDTGGRAKAWCLLIHADPKRLSQSLAKDSNTFLIVVS